MFAEERPALRPLPVEPFRYYQFGTRTVHLDGCVEVDARLLQRAARLDRPATSPCSGTASHVRLLDPTHRAAAARAPPPGRRGRHAIHPDGSAGAHAADHADAAGAGRPRRHAHRRALRGDPPPRRRARRAPHPRRPRARQEARRRRRRRRLRRRPRAAASPTTASSAATSSATRRRRSRCARSIRSSASSPTTATSSRRRPRRRSRHEPRRTAARPAPAPLSGMAAGLEAALLQAQAEKLAPIDFLSTLVGDELLRRQDRLLERRLKQAGFRDAGQDASTPSTSTSTRR